MRHTTLPLTRRDPTISPVFFQEMITSANLLESEIYEIQEVWTGQKDLRYTHCVMRSSPKGLQFFHLVSPSESTKVIGLKGIHHPNALCHHAGLSYCPWCGKEGQNKGTVVNHLQTTHYKLGLVCHRYLCFSVTTSKSMWHHGQVCRKSDAEEEDEGPMIMLHPHWTDSPQGIPYISSGVLMPPMFANSHHTKYNVRVDLLCQACVSFIP